MASQLDTVSFSLLPRNLSLRCQTMCHRELKIYHTTPGGSTTNCKHTLTYYHVMELKANVLITYLYIQQTLIFIC